MVLPNHRLSGCFYGKTLMIARLRPRAIFLIILLILVAAAVTGFVIRRTVRPIVYEFQTEIDTRAKPSGGTARRSARKPSLPTEPVEGAQRPRL
jgi:hypothetical protein